MTREEWLKAAISQIDREVFPGITMPEIQVSVGWPGGGSRRTRIGECWSTSAAGDGVAQVFISPTLEDAPKVLATLTHEMIHAIDDCENGHKAPFKRMALAAGLEGKMTATTAGEVLKAKLKIIADDLGTYPHAALTLSASGTKTQGTRMLKLEAECCGYTVRTTRKWVDLGLPSCPCGSAMVEA